MKFYNHKTIMIFFLLCILLSGCKTQTENNNEKESVSNSIASSIESEQILEMEQIALSSYISKIKIDPNSVNQSDFSLNDLVESIEYIPLETKDECVIGSINDRRSFKISDNYILVRCPKTGLFFLFNRKGRFIAQIGNIGEGPGDYLKSTNPYFINEENKQIILFAIEPDRYIYFDMVGKHIKTIHSENKDISERIGGRVVNYFNEGLLLMIQNFGETPFNFILLDNNFNTIARHVKPVQFTKNANFFISIRPPFSYYVYGNRMHVRTNILNDTLYFFENSQRIIPKYTINAGTYEVTTDLLTDQNFNKRAFLNLSSIFESKDYLFIEYVLQFKFYYCYYDKNKQKLFHFSSEKGISNDYDGGLDFWPLQQYNDLLFTFYDAYIFEENAKKTNITLQKEPQGAINTFKNISSKIDPDDNPVLVIAKLKK